MRKFLGLLAGITALAAAQPAAAAIFITTQPGNAIYSGPTPTYDFEGGGTWGGAPVTGGAVINDSVSNVRARPLGSTGFYWTVGPTDGSPGIMNLSSVNLIGSISFIWGSVDPFQKLEVLGAADTVLATFTGTNVFNPPTGSQTNPNTNPLVTLWFTEGDQAAVNKLRLSSTKNAFETDNFTINAVPEPGTWAMMLLGFGAIGFSMRRRKRFSGRLLQAA